MRYKYIEDEEKYRFIIVTHVQNCCLFIPLSQGIQRPVKRVTLWQQRVGDAVEKARSVKFFVL